MEKFEKNEVILDPEKVKAWEEARYNIDHWRLAVLANRGQAPTF